MNNHRIQPTWWVWRKSGLALDGTTEPVSRSQIVREERKIFVRLTTTRRIGNHTNRVDHDFGPTGCTATVRTIMLLLLLLLPLLLLLLLHSLLETETELYLVQSVVYSSNSAELSINMPTSYQKRVWEKRPW